MKSLDVSAHNKKLMEIMEGEVGQFFLTAAEVWSEMERYWMESNIFLFDCIGRSHVLLLFCCCCLFFIK